MKFLLLILSSCAACTAYAQSDSASFYFAKGTEEQTSKRYLVAHQNFSKAISFDADYTDAYIQNAMVAQEMRKIDWVKENLEKAHKLDPKNAVVIKGLTDLYYSYRQYQKAIDFAKKCNSCASANRIIGLSYYQLEDYTEAIKYLTSAIAQDPNNAEAFYSLGRSYLDIEDYKKAPPFYEKAIALDVTKSGWMYELGLLYYNNNDYKNAVVAMDKASASGYAVTNDFNENLGYAALYADQVERGETILLSVSKKKAGNTDILRSMAEILYQKKYYDKSLGYCQKLMEKDPNDGKALYQAGLCFLKMGQKDRGQNMCDKAIEMDPSLARNRTKKEMIGL